MSLGEKTEYTQITFRQLNMRDREKKFLNVGIARENISTHRKTCRNTIKDVIQDSNSCR